MIKHFLINRSKLFVTSVVLLTFACSSGQKKSEIEILAKVAGKNIGVNEFMRRAELTIRPGNYKNKYSN